MLLQAAGLVVDVRDLHVGCESDGLERVIAMAVDHSSTRIEAWLESDQSTPSRAAIRAERLVQLSAALERLPDAQRQAIEMHYFLGKSLAEVGQDLDRSPAAIGGLLHRGLKTRREDLSNASK